MVVKQIDNAKNKLIDMILYSMCHYSIYKL